MKIEYAADFSKYKELGWLHNYQQNQLEGEAYLPSLIKNYLP
jgi:hypothetical protein